MDEEYYNKYIKYKQKYIALKAQSNFAQGDSFKQKYIALKAQSNFAQGDSFKQKYIALKAQSEINQININQYGGKNKTYYVTSLFKINKEFIEYFKLLLESKKYIESSNVPINFVFIFNSLDKKNFLLEINNDYKNSQLINTIAGNTYEELINNSLFSEKYKDSFFIHPYQEIDINNIKEINKKYILDPKFTYGTTDIDRWLKNPRSLVSSKKEIEDIIQKNPQYKEWIIKDELTEPSLKNGRRITLNLIFVIKVKPLRIYFLKKKLYSLSKKLYDKDTFYQDGYVRETSQYHIYNRDMSFNENNIDRDILFFPDTYPDNWTKKETLEMDDMINNIVPLIFKTKINFETVFNSKNGYEILKATVDLYEGLSPVVHGIFTDWYPFLHKNILPGLISILIDNKDHKDFQRVNLLKKISSKNIKNYKFERQFSYGRIIPNKNLNKTYYVKTDNNIFDKNAITEFENRGYKKDSFPVEFIFILGEASYIRNRFNTKGSKWINLLYGNSKTEICNKILLNKKFEKSDFIIASSFLNINTSIPDLNETTIKILKPLNGFSGSGIKIVKTKNDINSWLKENQKYKEWIIQDYLQNPNLKDGKKFHLRILIVVIAERNKPIEVYIYNKKFYILAKEKYINGDWQNKNIHDTHFRDNKMTIFPEEYPDSWTDTDINTSITDMYNLFKKVFENQNEFYPEWNSINGFEIFGADVLFSNKKPYLLEINSKIALSENSNIISNLIDVILEKKENKYMTKLI